MTYSEPIARRGDTIIRNTMQGEERLVVTSVKIHSLYDDPTKKFRRYNVRDEQGRTFNVGMNAGDEVEAAER